VTLTRYGADIEWNMNLLLRPGDFQREMAMKLAAQEESLRAALIRIGYDMLMTEGTDLVAALVNSNPLYRSSPRAAEIAADKLYASSVFGAMSKFPFPVENLLAAAKMASAATIATADKTVMVRAGPRGLWGTVVHVDPQLTTGGGFRRRACRLSRRGCRRFTGTPSPNR
jgi:hypothetical protein